MFGVRRNPAPADYSSHSELPARFGVGLTLKDRPVELHGRRANPISLRMCGAPLDLLVSPAATAASAGRRQRRRLRRGFTLIEAAYVVGVVSLVVMATLELLAAGTVSNAAATHMSVARNLAGQIQETCQSLPLYDPQQPGQWLVRESTVAQYDNVIDFDGQTYTPPIDARRQTISGMAGWSQSVSVDPVSEADLTQPVSRNAAAKAARVTVRVSLQNKVIHSVSWVVFDKTP